MVAGRRMKMLLVKNVLAADFGVDGRLARRHATHILAARTELGRPDRRMPLGGSRGKN